MNPLKVLVLVHRDCVPPEGATNKSADWAHWKTEYYVKKTLKKLGHKVLVFPVTDELSDLQKAVEEFDPHIAFNLLEEFQGEPIFESHVAAFLELLGVPYTGCNPHGLALGRDKALSKKILKYHDIPTPGFFTVGIRKKYKVPTDMKFPMIVKSLNEEASLGISQKSVVYNEEDLKERIQFIHETIGTVALIEEYVAGREFYVGVLGNQNLKTLEPWELSFGGLKGEGHAIATRNVKFNKSYCDKYQIHRGPAKNLNTFTKKKLSQLSKEAYRALKMSGYARMDFRVTEKGDVYFLEANPNAELANKECLANAANLSGIKYEELIKKILQLGLSYTAAA